MARLGTFIYLSTAHLEKEVSAALTDKGPDTTTAARSGTWTDEVTVCEFAYGHWVMVPRPSDDDDETLAEHEERMGRLPGCLRDCLRLADVMGARWVLFDQDEDPIPQLREYDW